jgi:alpha-L-rhamnosidase
MVTIADLRCQMPVGVFAAGREPLRLTWRVDAEPPYPNQTAYQIEASSAADFATIVADSGVVEAADQVAVPAPGQPLHSREVRHFRVRIQTRHGWTDWGPTLRVEAGLLEPDDWVAQAITLSDDPGRDHQAPAPVVAREFDLPAAPASARLYVTSLGVHDVVINGRPVSDHRLAPGWTPYHRRLLAETHDVTALLVAGHNVVTAVLGDGWYRGRIGWEQGNDRCRYGRDVALIAQLEVELVDRSDIRIATDQDWVATTGEVRTADFYDGADLDLRLRVDGVGQSADWQPVVVVPYDPAVIEPRVAPPVRPLGRVAVTYVPRSDGTTRLDAVQNISGYVRLRVRGKPGDEVTVRHAEVLEPDGSLHTRSLRSARAQDHYTLADTGETVLEPAFTFHGFQHAEVQTDVELVEAEFVAISSDTTPRGSFRCSDELLTRLHENVVWSQRDNFVSVPTDCPQRDERLGWTGDAQAFAPTACTLFDSQAFWASWLRDLALEQRDDLGVPSVVPDVVLAGEPRYGRAGWADAATIVPWAVYESYGDPGILRAQLPSMKRWVASLRRRQGPDGLLRESWQFGDWLDPDAPVARPWEAKVESTYLANAFFVHSTRLAADAAALLGDDAWAQEHHALGDTIATATWSRWSDHAMTSQTGCAVALQLRVAPVEQRPQVAAALARLVRDARGRVSTGFLGTPLVLPALSEAGYIDEAYLMLLRRECPSWLYQVDQGATTVWERWDAIRPDGSIHPGTMTSPPDLPSRDDREPHMLSFNHYAYGAVIDWVYRNVAGLAPDRADPGYRSVILAPKPVSGIGWAEASVTSPYGSTRIHWRIEESGSLVADVVLPFGTTGTFIAPVTDGSAVTIDGGPAEPVTAVPPGVHTIVVERPRVAYPDAILEERETARS